MRNRKRQSLLLMLSAPLLIAAPLTEAARSQRVLVLGGTGQLGAQVVRELSADGHKVTVLARPNSDRKRLEGLDVAYVLGDVTVDADVKNVFQGRRFDVVVSALRVMDGDIKFYEKALTPVAKYAKKNRVKQIIHHGAVGAGANRAKFPTLGWERVPGLYDRLADQGVGEEILRNSRIAYTIIRNARIYPGETAATGKAELTEDDSVLTPMTRADLALFTKQCVLNKACYNKTYHVRDMSLTWPPTGGVRP
jgi:uncharacterized protein YbjT (DUF2867 family)